jgi:hypothetical protein
MRFWIDTEYHHNGQNIELISLGAVSEDDREFYAISTEFDVKAVKPWVKEQVLPYLEPRSSSVRKSLSEIRQAFVEFVGDQPAEFWSYISTNDWYLVTNLLPGDLDGLPHNWPFECWDLHQWAFHLGNPSIPECKNEHSVLSDARWHREVYAFLSEYQCKLERGIEVKRSVTQ